LVELSELVQLILDKPGQMRAEDTRLVCWVPRSVVSYDGILAKGNADSGDLST
jgi:hypothetical protein